MSLLLGLPTTLVWGSLIPANHEIEFEKERAHDDFFGLTGKTVLSD